MLPPAEPEEILTDAQKLLLLPGQALLDVGRVAGNALGLGSSPDSPLRAIMQAEWPTLPASMESKPTKRRLFSSGLPEPVLQPPKPTTPPHTHPSREESGPTGTTACAASPPLIPIVYPEPIPADVLARADDDERVLPLVRQRRATATATATTASQTTLASTAFTAFAMGTESTPSDVGAPSARPSTVASRGAAVDRTRASIGISMGSQTALAGTQTIAAKPSAAASVSTSLTSALSVAAPSPSPSPPLPSAAQQIWTSRQESAGAELLSTCPSFCRRESPPERPMPRVSTYAAALLGGNVSRGASRGVNASEVGSRPPVISLGAFISSSPPRPQLRPPADHEVSDDVLGVEAVVEAVASLSRGAKQRQMEWLRGEMEVIAIKGAALTEDA